MLMINSATSFIGEITSLPTLYTLLMVSSLNKASTQKSVLSSI